MNKGIDSAKWTRYFHQFISTIFLPLSIYLFRSLSLSLEFRFNTFFPDFYFRLYWQLIQHRFLTADKPNEMPNMLKHATLLCIGVPSLRFELDLFWTQPKTNRINIDLLNSSINRLSTKSNGKQQPMSEQKKQKKYMHAIDLHINT